jgi:hypothetical protein
MDQAFLGKVLMIQVFASFGGRLIDYEVLPDVELGYDLVQGRMVFQTQVICMGQNCEHLKMVVNNYLRELIIYLQDELPCEHEIYLGR